MKQLGFSYEQVFDGLCRDAKSEHVIKNTRELTIRGCYEECQITRGCVALSFLTVPKNCILFRGGPFAEGNGDSNTKCYIIKGGYEMSWVSFHQNIQYQQFQFHVLIYISMIKIQLLQYLRQLLLPRQLSQNF